MKKGYYCEIVLVGGNTDTSLANALRELNAFYRSRPPLPPLPPKKVKRSQKKK